LSKGIDESLLKAFEENPPGKNIKISDVSKITRGWETELYSFKIEYEERGERAHDDLILRLYPDRYAKEKSEKEFMAMSYLHKAGYPVPKVLFQGSESSPFGKPFIVMEKVQGRMMTDIYLEASEGRRRELMTLFCSLFVDLHDQDWRPFVLDPARYETGNPYAFIDRKLSDAQRAIESFHIVELKPVLGWLMERRSNVPCQRLSVIHLDYHPDNLMIKDDGSAVVIDWGSQDIGDYRSDLAWTMLLAGTYWIPEMRLVILNEYQRIAGRIVPHIEYFEVLAILRRLLDLAVSLTMGAENRGMRPGAEEQMREDYEHYRRVYSQLIERTGIKILEIERLINSLI